MLARRAVTHVWKSLHARLERMSIGGLHLYERYRVALHPQLSVGIGFGESLIAAEDHIFMVSLGIHGRAIDGRY